MFLLFAQLHEDLRQNLRTTMQQKYRHPGEEKVTQAVDKLQQEVRQESNSLFLKAPFTKLL